MCGIIGTFRTGPGPAFPDGQFAAALGSLAHRGPDDAGQYAQGRALLGHRRLSITDTSAAGHQPFTDAGGRYTIVFNGEVFNFRELRSRLEQQGHGFRSHTDTEVVLRLFLEKGPGFLHDLNGFFALAIHDAQEDRLFLARDRYGVKPLLWAVHAGHFMFASELRALLALGVPAIPDPDSARQFLTFFFTPAPHTTVAGIHKLLPGHAMHVDADGVRVEQWYDLADAAKRTAAPANPGQQLFNLLDDAVKLRLEADVPVGAFLSGGVDSSIISALAARHHRHLHTFSIGYADDPFFDETRYAEEVAQHIGSEHHTFKLGREELADGYVRLLKALDEPFADSSALPSFILCERTRKQVTVALSGDGADEVFGGYQKHQAELRWRTPGAAERAATLLAPLWSTLPKSRNSAWQNRIRQLDRFARMAGQSGAERFLQLAAFTPAPEAEAFVAMPNPADVLAGRTALLAAPLARLDGLNGVLLADMASTLPNDMLHKVDLTSMAHGMEVRPPFLDRRVVELAFALPAELKLRKGSGKHILRQTFGHLLPPTVMQRSKKGFEVPLRDLLRGPLAALVDEVLRPDAVAAAGLDPGRTAGLVRQLRSASPGSAQATIHALVVYVWWWTHRSGTQ
ncbi:MAG: asparagine synthase (glutamine-hydrolyzing) [Flavobacteriales bacterium]|nr:asparagine synthase (glutamine-hydrolyzing) [Flavobacteriales bacterium]